MIVRKHYRVVKGKKCVVRSHNRNVISHFKKKHKITTPIKLNLDHKAEGDSLAHHAMHYDSKIKGPSKHEVNVDVDKVKKAGENVGKVIKHELNHVLDVEKIKGKMKNANDTFSKSDKGKKLISKYRKGKFKNKSAKEIFAEKM